MPARNLVFLHGFLGNRHDWDALLPLFPEDHCICIDLPGHGDEPFSETFDFMPKIAKFHLIGYSMGGRIALQYAMKHSDRIQTLTLISAHSGLSSEKEKQQRLESDAAWAKLLLEAPIDTFLERWYQQPIFAGFKPDFSKRRSQNIQGLASALMHYSLGKQPALYTEKAFHIVGEKDAKFRSLYPNAMVIPNAGHALHLENPEALASIIKIIALHN